MLGRIVRQAGLVVLVALLVVLLLGQVLGQPLLLTYVETGSMEPTIDEGEGFVAVPSPLASSPSEGDIVTFDAEQIEGGGLTTHRIVDETDEGYITRGDANPFTDQDGGEPPVTEDRIVAHAVQSGDSVITIPYFGTAIETFQDLLVAALATLAGLLGLEFDGSPQSIGVGLLAVGLVLFAVSGISTGAPERSRARSLSQDKIDTRVLTVILLLVVLIPANAAMLLPAGETELVVEGDAVTEADDVEPGDEITTDLTASNDGLIALLIVSEPVGDDVTVEPGSFSVPSGDQATAEIALDAPPPDTDRTVTVEEERYLLLLPESLLLSLDETNPLLALGAINLLLAVGLIGAVGGLLGFGRVRSRDQSRDVSLWIQVKRLVRK